MKRFFSALPMAQKGGIAFIRIITGLLLAYHGWEVFDAAKMNEYAAWDVFKKGSSPSLMVYMGKSAELIAGILLLAGLFTRVAAIIVMLTFLYICFFVGNGKIWYEDQHPFLFVLLGLIFIFTGAGALSMDQLIFKKADKNNV